MRKRTIAILLAAGAVTASAFCMAGCSGCAAEEPAAPDADIVVPDVPGGTTEPGGEEQPPAEHEHVLEHRPAEAAACTADGHAEYWQCTGCGKYFADGGAEREVGFDSLLIKGGHAYVYGEVSAGCTTGGYEFAKCAACGDGYIVEGSATAPLEHDWGQWHTREEPGCESAGARERSCFACGAEEREELPPAGHAYIARVYAPGCNEGGCTEYVCTVCGDTYTDGYTDPLGHDWGQWHTSKEPGCESAGVRERSCIACGAEEREELPPAGHAYIARVHAAGCNEGGCTEYVCTACGDTYTDGYTGPLGHEYVSERVAATCISEGYTVNRCTRCGDAYIDEHSYVPASGHSYGEWRAVGEYLCTDGGTEERECALCGHTERRDVAPAEHRYRETYSRPAGCEETGYTEYECTACGNVYTGGYVAPLGHEYEEQKAEGTCTEPGYVLAVCVRCGDEYVKSVSSELGAHAVGEWEYLQAPSCTEDGVRWRKCENFDECGYFEEEEVPAVGHDRGGWVTVKAATCTAEGEQARECRVCGDVERRTVDELGHDYVASEAAGGTEYVCARCGDGYFLPDAEQEGAGAVYALSADGLSYIVTGAERGAAEIAIPDEHLGLPVTEIADGAFEGNTVITRATLGGNIARIGERAFYGCSSLLCVNVPESAEYMGEGAFGHCVALESVRYDAADIAECYNVFPNAGTEGGGLTLRVGAAVKRIPANLFYAPNGTAPGLEEVLFDEGSALEEIGDGAFSGCARLGRICLPASVARIGVEAFYGCASLEYARVPAAATVCSGAFADVSDAFDCVLF